MDYGELKLYAYLNDTILHIMLGQALFAKVRKFAPLDCTQKHIAKCIDPNGILQYRIVNGDIEVAK